MKKIYLSLNGLDLGYLVQNKMGYKFAADELAVKKAKQDYPDAMRFYPLNETGEEYFDKIPMPFAKFLISNERRDLIEKARILDNDDEFECLFKLSDLEFMEIIFKIHK